MKKLMIALSAAALALGASADVVKGTTFNEKDISVIEKGEGSETTFSDTEFVVSAGEDVTEYKLAGKGANLAVKTPLATPDYFNLDAGADLDGLFFDSVVKFTYCDEDAAVPDENAKLMVWVKENPDDATDVRLMVTAGYFASSVAVTAKAYDCGPISDYGIAGADDWCRLTVKCIPEITAAGDYVPGFNVYVNTKSVKIATEKDIGVDGTKDALTAVAKQMEKNNYLFPCLFAQQGMKITGVGFAGQGGADNVLFTTTVPTDKDGGEFILNPDPVVATVNGEECKDVDKINEELAKATESAAVVLQESIVGDLTFVAPVNTLDLNGKTVDGDLVIDEGIGLTISGDGMVNGALDTGRSTDKFKIAGGKYLASATEAFLEVAEPADPENYELKKMGAYWELAVVLENGTEAKPWKLASEADLMSKLVDKLASLDAKHQNYVMTGDIELTAKWPGIGIYKVEGGSTSAFKGVFDGAGHKISNVVMADNPATAKNDQNNYRGFFNQLEGATVKNLTVETSGFGENPPSSEYGCAAIAGHAFGSTIENCVSEGTISSGTHNVAGIVIRIRNSKILNCTNKADITGNYTKVAGICVLNQNDAAGESCLIEGCVNEGDITCANGSTAGRDGCAGIIAYLGDATLTIKDCENKGVIAKGEGASTTAQLGQIIGWEKEKVGAIEGVNKGTEDTVFVGTKNAASNVDGLNYATVEDGVASGVKDADLSVGNTYKVMTAGNKPVIALAAGESVSFDQSLAGITTSGITAPNGYEVEATGLEQPITYGAVILNYTITYMNGESPIALNPAQYTVEDEVTLPTELEGVVGVQLVGWYDNAELEGEPVTTIAKGTTGDKTFYAKTEVVVQKVPVTVPAAFEGGEYVVKVVNEEGGEDVLNPEPSEDVGSAKYLLPIGATVKIYGEPAEGYKVVGENPYVIDPVTSDTTVGPDDLPKFEKEGGYPDEWPVTDPATKAKFADWRAGAGADADLSQPEAKEAFLLNCAVADVDKEAAAFKITSFAQDAEGKWVATPTEKNTAGNDYNGKVTVKSYSDVGCKTEADNGNFFKAFLDFPAPAAE